MAKYNTISPLAVQRAKQMTHKYIMEAMKEPLKTLYPKLTVGLRTTVS